MPADPFLAEARLSEMTPRSLDTAATNAMKPPRVMSLGQRIREDGYTVLWVAAAINILIALPAMFVIGIFTALLFPDWKFTPGAFVALYGVSYMVSFFGSALMANSMLNEDVTSATKRDEDLIRAIRLPLLEWAVKNDAVDKITGLDETLALAVAHYQKSKQRS